MSGKIRKFSSSTDMSVKNELLNCLNELKTLDYTDDVTAQASDGKAEDVLNLIYQAGLRRISFSPEEEETLGSLLANAIRPIQMNIEGAGCEYRTRLDNIVLVKRSAIQFLIDSFAKFPVDNTNLAAKLEEADIKESVEILDEIIDRCCNMSDSDEGSSDRESAGAKEVPSSHTWWFL